MNTRLPSKDIYHFTIRSNIYQLVLLSLLIFLPWNTNTVLDIVSHTLWSSEILMGTILISNFFIGLYISQKSNFVKKSVSYKVSIFMDSGIKIFQQPQTWFKLYSSASTVNYCSMQSILIVSGGNAFIGHDYCAYEINNYSRMAVT